MRNLRIITAMLLLGVTFIAQAQEEKEIAMDLKRPKDVKMQNLDSWKNSVFDLYDNMMAIKAKGDSDASFDAAAEVKPSTGEILLLAGKSILMVREAKKAPGLKKAKAIPTVVKCKKALTMCKRYANSVLGDGAVEYEEEGK